MQSNMLRFVTFDFILWLFRGCMVGIPLKVHVLPMSPDNRVGEGSASEFRTTIVSNCKFYLT
jgi:hypothetical protein